MTLYPNQMKTVKAIIIGLALVAGVINLRSQQLMPVTTVVTNQSVPSVTWTNEAASAVAVQLLSVTNEDGSPVIPANFLASKARGIIIINWTMNTNGTLKTLTANVR